MRRRFLLRLRPRPGSEAGMSILELVLAMTVMLGALLTIAHAGTAGLAVVASSRHRQASTALGGLALEKIRALPFDTMALGHDTGDLAAATTVGSSTFDPYIVKDGADYKFTLGDTDASNDERMPNANRTPDDEVPMVDPRVVEDGDTKVDGVQYRIATYISIYNNSGDSYRVTTVVSWPDPSVPDGRSEITTQSVLASPDGCLGTTTRPFAGPCRAFYYGVAGMSNAAIEITGATGQAFKDLDVASAHLTLPVHISTLQLEQTQSVSSRSTASGVRIADPAGSAIKTSGYQSVTSQASNDANLSAGTEDSASLVPPTGDAVAALKDTASPPARLRLVPGINDVGDTVTVTQATGPPSLGCKDESKKVLMTSSPCANSSANQVGSSTYPDARIEIKAGGVSDPWMLANVAPPGSDDNWATTYRDNADSSVTCSTATLASERCIRSVAKRKLGQVDFAGLSAEVTGPSGWNGYLVRLTGFTDTVTASAGSGEKTGPAGPSASVAGTISYWAGETTGYVSLTDLDDVNKAIDVQPVEVAAPAFGAGGKVKITADLRTGGVTYVNEGTCLDTPTPDPCIRKRGQATSSSPILGTIRYVVTNDAGTIVDFVMTIDLGTLTASATYEPPPSAV